jgi:hypothetical protein
MGLKSINESGNPQGGSIKRRFGMSKEKEIEN